MAIAPVSRLTKSEIIWLSKNRCRHNHTYLEHYNCYLTEILPQRKIGFFDIETSNLHANYGILYSYAIKDGSNGEVYHNYITKKELLSKDIDKKLVSKCIDDLKRFDIIVTYYGTKFDFPYIRTRAVHHGIHFPSYGEITHIDLYYVIKNKFRLHSNRLENACLYLLGSTRKTKLDGEYWVRAMTGDKKSIEKIDEHCVADVEDLHDLYNCVIQFKKRTDLSI